MSGVERKARFPVASAAELDESGTEKTSQLLVPVSIAIDGRALRAVAEPP